MKACVQFLVSHVHISASSVRHQSIFFAKKWPKWPPEKDTLFWRIFFQNQKFKNPKIKPMGKVVRSSDKNSSVWPQNSWQYAEHKLFPMARKKKCFRFSKFGKNVF